MKVKGRIEKWVPGRNPNPPEEGAVGGEGVNHSTIDRQVSLEDNTSQSSSRASVLDLSSHRQRLQNLDLEYKLNYYRDAVSSRVSSPTGPLHRNASFPVGSPRGINQGYSTGMDNSNTQGYSTHSTSQCSSTSTSSFSVAPAPTSPGENLSNYSSTSLRSGSIGTNSSSLPGISGYSTSSSNTIHHILYEAAATASNSPVPRKSLANQAHRQRYGSKSNVHQAIDPGNSSPSFIPSRGRRLIKGSSSSCDNSEKDEVFLLEPLLDNSSTGSADESSKMESETREKCKMNIPTDEVNSEETDLHRLPGQGSKKGKKDGKSQSRKLRLELQTINQPASDKDLVESCQRASAYVTCNGGVPKVKSETDTSDTDKVSMTLSPNRKVTFHESVLQAAETRKLVLGDTVRIVRVRDAAVNTPHKSQSEHNTNTPVSVTEVTQPIKRPNVSPKVPHKSVMAMRMQPAGDAGSDVSSGTGDDDDDDDESKSTMVRETWSGKLDFLVSALGYAIGLGNVWRFPYLCYKNGGGAFLLPYFLFVIVVGIPMVFLEVSFGQFAGLGPISIWNVSPIFKGVGMTMIALSLLVSVYYNVILSWALFYLFASMQYPLPWTSCNNSWNTQDCCTTRFVSVGSCQNTTDTVTNSSCYFICGDSLLENGSYTNYSGTVLDVNPTLDTSPGFSEGSYNSHLNHNDSRDEWLNESMPDKRRAKLKSPAEEYFSLYMLGGQDYGWLLGRVQWKVALCLLLTTLVIFLCLFKGAKTSGKVTYLTVIAPYFILLVLLIKTSTLEGAKKGIVFYMSPQWSRLADPQVWHDAINQVFFSLAPCYGGLITLASFNKFHHNCYRDALLIPIGNCLTSIFAGFPIFCTLGYMATHLGTDIKNVVSTGTGLAFVVYPEAVAQLPGSTVWAILFFLMLLALGLDTLLVYVVTIVTAIMDEYPKLLYRWRLAVLCAVCLVLYIGGLPLVTQGGVYVLEMLDKYVTSYPPVIVGILECIILMWVYGYNRFAKDVWYMFGKQPGRWWRLLWQFVTPSLLLFLLIFSGVSQNILPYVEGGSPERSFVIGWAVAGACILPIPLYALYASITVSGSIVKRFRRLFQPAEGWGLYTEQIDGHTILPDYIKSEEEEEESPQVVPSVGDIPELPPHQHTGDHRDDPMDKGFSGIDGEDIDTGSLVWDEDENKERGNWNSRYDFLMAGLGYTVGLGNVWRFPYLVYKNGGGAFFLPYLLMLVVCGLPLMFMELAMGQFASVGAITIWKVSPLFKGIGYLNLIVLFLVALYYNVLSGWAVYYLFASISFTDDLPWLHCNNTWNTEGLGYAASLTAVGVIIYYNALSAWALYYISASFTTSLPWEKCGNPWNTPACRELKATGGSRQNGTAAATCHLSNKSLCSNVTQFKTPSEEYFYNEVLNVSSGISEMGSIQWPLALCMLASTVFTFIALIKGVKSIGKVVYVTVTFPYLILLVLLARYVTLGDGHLDGIKYYVTPQWHRLHDATVWGDAASQLFFSLGLSMGGLISLASYNRFHYDCYRDAYLICLVDTLTSVFSGFVIFAILGVMAEEAGIDIQDVVTNKFGLAYVVYPEAVTRLPLAPFWSLLFFLMLFCLAIDSQFLMTASIVISLHDEFQTVLAPYRVWLSLAICLALYFLGLPMASQGGLYFLILLDYYVAAWCPIVVGILTCVAVCWVYGLKSFLKNMRAMLGTTPSFWWQGLWKFVTPTVLLIILLFIWAQYKPPVVDHYEYPPWANTLGVLLGVGPLITIPITCCVQLARTPGSGLVIIRRAMAPSEGWGPALKHHRISVYLPQLPALEPTWSNNWLLMAKEMSIYATETSAVVAMAAGAYETKNVPARKPSKKFKEKTVTITISGASSDKTVQTDGHHPDEEHTVVSPRKSKRFVQTTDVSTQTPDTPKGRRRNKRRNSSETSMADSQGEGFDINMETEGLLQEDNTDKEVTEGLLKEENTEKANQDSETNSNTEVNQKVTDALLSEEPPKNKSNTELNHGTEEARSISESPLLASAEHTNSTSSWSEDTRNNSQSLEDIEKLSSKLETEESDVKMDGLDNNQDGCQPAKVNYDKWKTAGAEKEDLSVTLGTEGGIPLAEADIPFIDEGETGVSEGPEVMDTYL